MALYSLGNILFVGLPKAASVALLFIIGWSVAHEPGLEDRYADALLIIAVAELATSGLQPLSIHRYKLTQRLPSIALPLVGFTLMLSLYFSHEIDLAQIFLGLAVPTAKLLSAQLLASARYFSSSFWYQFSLMCFFFEYVQFGTFYCVVAYVVGVIWILRLTYDTRVEDDVRFLLAIAPQHFYARLLAWGVPAYLAAQGLPGEAAILQLFHRASAVFSMPASVLATISMPNKVQSIAFSEKDLLHELLLTLIFSSAFLTTIFLSQYVFKVDDLIHLGADEIVSNIPIMATYVFGLLSGLNVCVLGYLNLNDSLRRADIYVYATLVLGIIIFFYSREDVGFYINVYILMSALLLVSSLIRVAGAWRRNKIVESQ